MADYVDIDMDAGFDYEPSIVSSNGDITSGDHSLGDHTIDGVEEGSLFPTTLRPNEESASSEGKGQSDRHQDCTKTGSQHDEGSPSKCSSLSKIVRIGTASPRSHHSGASSASCGHISPVSLTKDGIEHAFPASSTIPS